MVTLPDGSELSIGELQEMASQQQHQIDAQHQMMVAKEQRLKYLKQQEQKHENSSADRERLAALRRSVQAQEMKLCKLRALHGHIDRNTVNNNNLASELETIRALFNEKEKELSLAVAKVDELTRQLEDVRRGKQQLGSNNSSSPAALELEKLRKELLYRNKLNEQQNKRMAEQRETLNNRKEEVSRMDKRICELQQRLQRKRSLNQQLSNQINAATSAKQAQLRHNKSANGLLRPQNIAAIEPYNHTPVKDHAHDDLHTDFHPSGLNKNDPKYQTLPYNTKFLVQQKQKTDESSEINDDEKSNKESVVVSNKENTMPPVKAIANSISNLTPKPYVNNVHNSISTNNSNNNAPVVSVPHITSRIPVPVSPNSSNASSDQQNLNSSNSTTSSIPSPIADSKAVILHPQISSVQSPTVYQTISTPVTAVHSQTLSSSSTNGTLQEVKPIEVHDTPPPTNIEANKPVLPPKPCVPSKPVIPPRQIYSNNEKVDTSSASVDTALNILKGSDAKQRHAGKNVINSFSKRFGPSVLEQHMKSMNQLYKPAESSSDDSSQPEPPSQTEEQEPKKINQNELPIKPKPLTIKKSSSAEPPKLRSANGSSNIPVPSSQPSNGNNKQNNVHVSVNRRIEIPPAFHFPELKTSELKNNKSNRNEDDDFGSKVVAPPNVVITDVAEPINDNKTIKVNEDVVNDNVVIEDGTNNDKAINNTENSTEQALNEDTLSVEERHAPVVSKLKKGNLKTDNSVRNTRRVSFDPHALLLDASLEGELALVKKTAKKVPNPSAANDEGITALHNAICAGHFEVVKFLVEFGCDVNAQDSDGWTPLHCAASCNNLPMVKFLVENGACIFATTLSDHETAAEKCEEDEEGFDGCSEYLYSIQEKLGILNNGVVFAVYDFEANNADELTFNSPDMITVLRKGDEFEREWWWSRINDTEGYIPRNLLGLYPRRPDARYNCDAS